MRKIMFITSYLAPYGGNFIASLSRLADKLIDRGVEVIFVLPIEAKELIWARELLDRYRVFHIPLPNNPIDFKIIKILKRLITSEKIDIVYSHFGRYDIPSYFAAPKNCLLFYHMHDPINTNERIPILKKIKERLKYSAYRRKVHIVTCAEHLMNYVVSHGFQSEKCTFVINGIDLSRLYDHLSCRSVLPNDPKKKILMHGWDPQRKGVDTAIEACRNMNEEVTLYITYVHKNLMDDFFKRKYQGKIPDYVRLIPSVDNIMQYLNGADIFISPSRAEGSPYALMEAIAAGLPSVGTSLPGLDWQKEIPGLWTIDIDDSEGLRNAISEIIQLNTPEKNELINNSKKIIENKYCIESWSNLVLDYMIKNSTCFKEG